MNKATQQTELIIAPNGTVYHLDLKASDGIPPNLILVGAASRVDDIATHFDEVYFTHTNKDRPEFYITCGTYKGVPVGALSVGMGTPSMEIACNELHALFEYDHTRDVWHTPEKPINIIRLGTAGTSLRDIPLGAYAITQYSLGLDNAGVYYPVAHQSEESFQLLQALRTTSFGAVNPALYVAPAHAMVVDALQRVAGEQGAKAVKGLTTTSPGFFAAEGRQVGRLTTAFTLEEFIKEVEKFSCHGMRIVSHEMETSILFRILYEQLGWVGALCVILDVCVAMIVSRRSIVSAWTFIITVLSAITQLSKKNNISIICTV